MEEWTSELEHYLNPNEIPHSLDLPSQVDSIPLMEAAIGWHLTAIPDLPPLLTFIPSNELQATAISDVAEPYQSNLASHNDLIPLHLYPLLSDEAEGEIRFPPFANSITTVLQGDEFKSKEKIRNFSSSDSSKTSDACFMSADEGDSFAEELFYDPMKVESMETHNETEEVLLRLVDEEESSLELHLIMVEDETTATEKPIIYNDVEESLRVFSSDEKSQADITGTLTQFDRSPESAFSTEHFDVVDTDKKSGLQFSEQQEASMLNESGVGVKSAEDSPAVNENVIKEIFKEVVDSPNQLKDGNDDDKGRLAMRFEMNQCLEEAQETSADMGFEERPSLQPNAGREPIISTSRVDETETVFHFQGASPEGKSMVLDEEKQAGTSEISSELDKSHDSSDVFKEGHLEHGHVDGSTELAILNENLVSSVKKPFLMDNHKAAIHGAVSGFEEQLFRESSGETEELVKQQGDFEVLSGGIANKMYFGSEKVCESTPETCEMVNLGLLTAMNLVFEKEPPKDRLQASKFELSSYFHEVTPLHNGILLTEEQSQAGSSETCCAFHEFDNLSSTTDKDKCLKTDLISSFETNALQKPLTKDSVEATPETDDSIGKTWEASIKMGKIEEEEAHTLKFGKEKILDTPVDYTEATNLSEVPSLHLICQVEPLKDRVQVGESESVQFFNEASSPENGDLLLDEKKQAGSSEISGSFAKSGESATASGVLNEAILEKNWIHGDESVAINADIVLCREDPSIEDQQIVGSSEVVSAFDKEIVEEKSTDITKSSLHVSENKDFLQEAECDKAPLKIGIEQTEEGELEMTEELCMKEELGQTTNSHVEPVTGKLFIEGSDFVLNFRENSTENAKILPDEREQAGFSEMSSAFNDSIEVSHSTETSDGVMVEENRANVFTLNVADYGDITPAQEGGSRVKSMQQESVLSIKLEELDRNDVSDKHGSLINTDLEPLGDGLEANLTQIVVRADGFQVEKIDSRVGENVDDLNSTTVSDVSIAHEEPLGRKKPSTEPKGVEVAIDLQPPIAPRSFGIEKIDCCNNEEIATVILHPETYSAEYHLPQNLELHTLEQPFNLLEKRRDSEERVVKGVQQRFDGRMVTLSSEIVVSDDNRSEAEQCVIHETSTEG